MANDISVNGVSLETAQNNVENLESVEKIEISNYGNEINIKIPKED